VLAGIAVGALSLLRQDDAAPATAPATSSGAVEPNAAIDLPGRVQARQVVAVAAHIDGTLESVDVAAGEEVFEGQLLARLRNTGLEAAREQATEEMERARSRLNTLESLLIAARLEASRASADAARARGEYDRTAKLAQRQQMLHREGATPRLVYEKAQKEHEAVRGEYDGLSELARITQERVGSLGKDVETARRLAEEKNDELELAVTELQSGELRSPVDGIVVAVKAAAGEEVSPAIADLFQIAVDLSQLDVVVEPPPNELARIRAGQPVLIQLAELPDRPLDGTVREVKQGQVLVEFASPTQAIRPGLTAQVRFRLP